ncbi:unnamed protein product [Psylliodes chrysocephalus]|uniref:Uncharacterized protein n=1 Tax=Psylliodes chrysocephalus TaxID=3402493 RepID=A0A9P0CKC3_9CUCU|nr:unnamed protein product [Psylliodes chrysocephala]
MCINPFLNADQDILNPNIDGSESLLCYQCNSTSSEITPLCDVDFFKLTNPLEKLSMMFHCPPHIGSYCFTTYSCSKEECVTIRGCSNDVDRESNSLKSGCIVFETDDDVNKTCFCKNNLCNRLPEEKSRILVYYPECAKEDEEHEEEEKDEEYEEKDEEEEDEEEKEDEERDKERDEKRDEERDEE